MGEERHGQAPRRQEAGAHPSFSLCDSCDANSHPLQTFWEPKASADVDLVLREFAAGNAGDAKVRPSRL